MNDDIVLLSDNLFQLYELFKHAFKNEILDKDYNIEKFEKHLKYMNVKKEVTFIYFNKDEPVGFLLGSFKEKNAYIPAMAVLKKYRKSGFGKAMLQRSANLFKTKQCKIVSLDVLQDNSKAIDLYLKEGFKIDNEIFNLRNENNSFFTKKKIFDFDVVSPKDFTFHILFNTFHRKKVPWKKGLSSLLYKLNDGTCELHLITKHKKTFGYALVSRDGRCLNIHDIALKEYDKDILKYFISSLLNDEVIVLANGLYSDDPLCEAFQKNGFYIDLKQYEMSKVLE